MTTFLLIRHAMTDVVGRTIAGWIPGVHLNHQGKLQAEQLAAHLAGEPLTALYSSPLERAMETAAAIGGRVGKEIEISNALGEVNFGEWTGRTIDDLSNNHLWRRFNTHRSLTHPPGGESMLEVQVRIINEMERLAEKYAGGTLALVSHGDVIRAAVLHYAGMPIDLFLRLEISPASFSRLELNDGVPRILQLNYLYD